jgi:hypothetical protein
MISLEEWSSILTAYSRTIWPAQIIFYLLAILLTGWFLFNPKRVANAVVKLYFVLVFAWIGVLWYFTLAKGMAGDSYGNYFFGAVFILVSALFGADIFRNKMQFTIPTVGWQRYISLTLFVLTFCYPLFGLLLGHDVDKLIFPGAYPCPTIALAILVLTTALPHIDKVIFFLLLFLAIPFTSFIQIARYHVYEDVVLFATGVYGLFLYLRVELASN